MSDRPMEQGAPVGKSTSKEVPSAQAEKQVAEVERILAQEPKQKPQRTTTANRGGVKIIHKETGLVGYAQTHALPAWEQRGWTAVDDK